MSLYSRDREDRGDERWNFYKRKKKSFVSATNRNDGWRTQAIGNEPRDRDNLEKNYTILLGRLLGKKNASDQSKKNGAKEASNGFPQNRLEGRKV